MKCWKRSRSGLLKLNVDVALFSNSWQVGVGAIVCHEYGSFVKACARKVTGCFDSYTAESSAIHEVRSRMWLDHALCGIGVPQCSQ
ncbi:hypothetical protein TorRG33x02_203040 [Trema orientale]|uniref:RNase H type-1 domain-containing protein n=1 Tax=Trema orientale TaxID=63057 RepID=A0A2P5EEP2_TREOI|nr:hypothetical protein TorRG33x02_203040 [Trema orientale]